MNIDLSGKTALVTGSTGGIGFAIVRGLAACGAQVAVNGRKQETVDAALAKIRAALPAARPPFGSLSTTTWPTRRAATRLPVNPPVFIVPRSKAPRPRSIPRNCVNGCPTTITGRTPSGYRISRA